MDPKVDEFLRKAAKWQEETAALRRILLDCGLDESLKWGKPCYACRQGNVAIIQGFKDTCALMFFKGALLQDPGHILEPPGANSRAARRVTFTGAREIREREPLLKAYIHEAVEAEKAGLKVQAGKDASLVFPKEFQAKLEEDPALQTAFEALTPGRQRAYHLYFTAPKRSATRTSRVEKCIPRILEGKGLNDR